MTRLQSKLLLGILMLISFALHSSPKETNDYSFTIDVNLPLKNNPKKPDFLVDRIVIDAGHGGRDHGCQGSHTTEKHIVMDIAKKLGSMIRYTHPEVEVIYTRETDVFIPLHRRIEMANQNNADLFISIHCNHFSGHTAHGAETYVMGLHNTIENLEVAKRENASILYEPDFQSTYDGFDPRSPETHIILSAFQNQYFEHSIALADKIQNSFGIRSALKNRGVKQAGFVVLRKATMPSVLVETGFLSNEKDESYLKSDEGQEEVAKAILIAISEYKKQIEKHDQIVSSNTYPNKEEKEKINIPAKTTASTTKKSEPTINKSYTTQKSDVHANSGRIVSRSKPYTLDQVNQTPTRQIPKDTNPSRALVYKVQIAASLKKPIENQWSQVTDLDIRQEDKMYKYLTGTFTNLVDAMSYRDKMISSGFKGAFVVAYQGSNRIQI